MFEIISVIRINLSFSSFFVKREREIVKCLVEPCSYRDCRVFGWTVNRALTVVNPVFFLFHYSYSKHTSIKNHHRSK